MAEPRRRKRRVSRKPATSTGRRAATRKLPTSGSEETYTNFVYGSPKGKVNNNCYAWAIGHYRNSGGVKLQPGDLSGALSDMSLSSCKDLKKRVMADSRAPGQKAMYVVNPRARCRKGFYKVMAFLDKDTDYHWYRQHKDLLYRVQAGNSLTSIATKLGVPPKQVVTSSKDAMKPNNVILVRDADVWSHKQGFATGPLLQDACGKVITDPRKACRDYGNYNYDTFCGAYCVEAKHPDIQNAIRAFGKTKNANARNTRNAVVNAATRRPNFDVAED
jgi:hypothetical protein